MAEMNQEGHSMVKLQVAVGSDADLEAGVGGGGSGRWRRHETGEQDATPLNLTN